VQVGRRAPLGEPDAHEAVVEVVVVGAERRAAVLEPLEDHERRVEDRHGQHEHRRDEGDRGGRLEQPVERERGEQEAERERARVAHEDLRRVVVVAQEAERGAADDGGQGGRVRAQEGRGEDRERGRGDRHDAGGQRVHAVDEVHEVGHAGDPQHRQGIGQPAQVVVADERQGDVAERDVVARDGDERQQRHAGELAARAQAAQVVVQAERGDAERAEQDPDVLVLEAHEQRRGDEDARDDGQPADPGDRLLVHARAVLRVVEPADVRGQPRHEGREDEHERRCAEETPDDRAVRGERAKRVREGHGARL
jgi:hypothetical protein